MEVVALHHDGLRPRGRRARGRVGRVGGGVAARAGGPSGRDEVGRCRSRGARSADAGGDSHRGAVVHTQADRAGRRRNGAHLGRFAICTVGTFWDDLFSLPGMTGIPLRGRRRWSSTPRGRGGTLPRKSPGPASC